MESRFTALLLPILLGLGLLYFLQGTGRDKSHSEQQSEQKSAPLSEQQSVPQSAPQSRQRPQSGSSEAAPAPARTQDPRPTESVDHTFGTPGRTGFQVRWSLRGAGIRHILLNDEYTSTAARDKATKQPKDYYSIVGEYRGDELFPGLVLMHRGREERFKKDPSDSEWQVEEKDGNVRFFLDMGDGLVLEKVFRYQEGRRDLELVIGLSNRSAKDEDLPSQYPLWLRGVEVWNPKEDQLLYNPAGTLAQTIDAQNQATVTWVPATAKPESRLPELVSTTSQRLGFAGTTNRFFAAFLYPEEGSESAITGVKYALFPDRDRHPAKDATIMAHSTPVAYYQLRLKVPERGKTETLRFRLYLGPKSTRVFAKNPDTAAEYERFDVIMDQDLRPGCCFGLTIPGVRPLAKGLIWLLRLLQSGVGNWGVAIIFLTLLVRSCLSPLNFRMQKTMREFGHKMAVLKPQLEALQKKYQNDSKRLQMEMMKFNREHKLMTQPLKGCLPLFLTMPIWIGLFTALRVMYELRQQPFLGWIDDLSHADRLFHLGIPFVEHFNLLPLVMVALWWFLQRGTPLPKDPQQRQMAVMMRFMPLLFGVLLYNYAAGLMVYMITSSLWGIVEQRITKKILGPISPEAAQAGTMPMM